MSLFPRVENPAARRPRVLIVHPWMGYGGSEATAAWTTQALQEDYEVTFASASDLDWDRINSVYGTSIDPASVETTRTTRLPGISSGTRLAHLQQAVFERACAALASDFDLCISTYNFVNFRKPALQLVADYSFSEPLRTQLTCADHDRVVHRDSLLRRLYLALGERIRNSENQGGAHLGVGDVVLANSEWMASQLRDQLGIKSDAILYPPVALAPEGPPERIPYSFVILGRIDPEKRLHEAIEILEAVRESSFPGIALTIAGPKGSDAAYCNRVFEMIEERSEWIRYVGFLDVEELTELLQSTSCGIHTRRAEAFGIAVAEFISFGCMMFAPDDSGPAEIVRDPRLLFDSTDDAIKKITTVLGYTDVEKSAIRATLIHQAHDYNADRFVDEIRRQVERALGGGDQTTFPDDEPPVELSA